MNYIQDNNLCECRYCSALGCLCMGRALGSDLKQSPSGFNLFMLLTK